MYDENMESRRPRESDVLNSDLEYVARDSARSASDKSVLVPSASAIEASEGLSGTPGTIDTGKKILLLQVKEKESSLYVARDSARSASDKEKSTYSPVPKRDDQFDKSVLVPSASAIEASEGLSGTPGTIDTVKKILILKGKEKESSLVGDFYGDSIRLYLPHLHPPPPEDEDDEDDEGEDEDDEEEDDEGEDEDDEEEEEVEDEPEAPSLPPLIIPHLIFHLIQPDPRIPCVSNRGETEEEIEEEEDEGGVECFIEIGNEQVRILIDLVEDEEEEPGADIGIPRGFFEGAGGI